MEEQEFKITFWGVRGSYPVPGAETLKVGGNTPCVQLEIGERLLILDAGTGISRLGQKLETKNKVQGDIFLSHTHWDHIQGFPFFTPGFAGKNSFTIYGRPGIKEILAGQMRSPYFPVKLEQMKAKLEFEEVTIGDTIDLPPGIKITPFANPHPDEAFSFRIEQDDRVCCYVTDIEPQVKWEAIVNFVAGADVVIYDSHYTDSEYLGQKGDENKLGWGHSTWQEGIRIVQAAEAEKLVLFHHAPWRSDDQLKRIECQAQAIYANTVIAQEEMVISL